MGSKGRQEDSLNQGTKPRVTSVQKHRRKISAITGTELHCKSWQIEGAYRMIHNVLDREVAKDPDHLIVYGGAGSAARFLGARGAKLATPKKPGGGQNPLLPNGQPGAGVKNPTLGPPGLLVDNIIVSYI